MNTKKLFFGINVVLAIAVFVGNYFYMTVGGLKLKSLCSSGFALMGVINLVYAFLNKQKKLKFNVFMAIGLIFAMSGDIVLDLNFIAGAALFAVGHIFYLTSYYILKKIKLLDIIVSAVLFIPAGAFVLFCPRLNFSTEIMKWVCFVYALIISAMVGKAISNFIRERNLLNFILMVGAILFFISDLMLLLRWFMNLGEWAGTLCLATYYPAECILAYATFHYAAIQNKNKATS